MHNTSKSKKRVRRTRKKTGGDGNFLENLFTWNNFYLFFLRICIPYFIA